MRKVNRFFRLRYAKNQRWRFLVWFFLWNCCGSKPPSLRSTPLSGDSATNVECKLRAVVAVLLDKGEGGGRAKFRTTEGGLYAEPKEGGLYQKSNNCRLEITQLSLILSTRLNSSRVDNNIKILTELQGAGMPCCMTWSSYPLYD
jgi:hypothetical protein